MKFTLEIMSIVFDPYIKVVTSLNMMKIKTSAIPLGFFKGTFFNVNKISLLKYLWQGVIVSRGSMHFKILFLFYLHSTEIDLRRIYIYLRKELHQLL